MANFKRPGSDPSQQWLFARSLDELVPADCDVRVIPVQDRFSLKG